MNFAQLFESKQPVVCGVLNVTPDSFSDGGEYVEFDAAIDKALELHEAGAAVVDIGGESTGPGAIPITAEEEQERIIKIVKTLASKLPLSIDTYHSATAAEALEYGAMIVNDVSAMRADKEMARVVSANDAAIVLMYCKDHPLPHVSKNDRFYEDVIKDIAAFFEERIEFALANGIKEEKIILDPGMGGFVSLRAEVSWELLARLEELISAFPKFKFLIGTSRKGFLGVALKDRDPLSQLTALHAAQKGAHLLRTHNPQMLNSFLQASQKLMCF